MTAAKCPATGKVQHASEGRAWAAIRTLRNGDLLAYPCGDHWHVGHPDEAMNARVRRALRRAR